MGDNREKPSGGFVELVDYMGTDYAVLRSARVSTGARMYKGEKKDRGLIRYLYRNEHMTPFEFPVFTWHIKCPIFVARQFFRHRMFSFNEASGRYKEFKWETFTPREWRKQDIENEQGSLDELDFSDTQEECYQELHSSYKQAERAYATLLSNDVASEQARFVMPVGHYTEFFMNTNLRNLLHFLNLRMDSHAQKETRDVACAMYNRLKGLDEFKWTMEIFDEMRAVKGALSRLVDTHKKNLYDLVSKLDSIE